MKINPETRPRWDENISGRRTTYPRRMLCRDERGLTRTNIHELSISAIKWASQ